MRSVLLVLLFIICYYGLPAFGLIYVVPHLLRSIDPMVARIPATKYYYFDLFSYNAWLGMFASLMCIVFFLLCVFTAKKVIRYM